MLQIGTIYLRLLHALAGAQGLHPGRAGRALVIQWQDNCQLALLLYGRHSQMQSQSPGWRCHTFRGQRGSFHESLLISLLMGGVEESQGGILKHPRARMSLKGEEAGNEAQRKPPRSRTEITALPVVQLEGNQRT